MSVRDGRASPVCSVCGRPQPPAGPLRTSNGTPISASTYLAAAALAGDALVCTECLASPDVRGADPVSGRSGLPRRSPSGHIATLLDEKECRRLLPTQQIGRLAFTQHARPVVLPAHFVLRGPEIVLAGLTDGLLAGARRAAVVAFEVDAYDPATRQGWWVCALGPSRRITDRSRIRHLDAVHFPPWADDPERDYIAIDIDVLHGRRLRREGNRTADEAGDASRGE